MSDKPGTDEIERAIEAIVENVLSSPRYRQVCADTVRRIATLEWTRQATLTQAIKSTKSKLHQVYGAYESSINYRRAYQDLERAFVLAQTDCSLTEVRLVCHKLLSFHASTRERLHILDQFFTTIFGHTGIPRVLLDLACGLNPLALPWMDLEDDAVYHAYDIDGKRIAFLNRYFALPHVKGEAHLQDILCSPPGERADLALLLKTSACLEQQQKGSTLALLDALNVSWIVVTFPVKSLGRREKGMVKHYENIFSEMISGRTWPVTRFAFATELAFVVEKPG
ncbi:MAG: Rmt family 16S rRNA (guanine(1405)-N(7))-methyltransferase [Anaerolineae bacterium]|nr:Rmt family 16S rRNA (guanine(1405)-N(7))-methyltransferase [Anaerolineae bacterium]